MSLPSTPFAFILYFVRKQWMIFVAFIIFSMCWAINDTIFPYFLKRIVDTLQHYQGNRQQVYSAVAGTLMLLVTFWLVMEAMQRAKGFLQIVAFPRFRVAIRSQVFDYVKNHSQEYFASHFAGNVAKRLSDLPTSCQAIVEIVCFQFVTAALGSVMIIVMMWLARPLFALIVLIWLAIHLGLTFIFLQVGNRLSEKYSDALSILNGKMVDVFTNMINVRLFARGRYELAYLKQYQDAEVSASKKSMWVNEFMQLGLGLNGLFLIFGMVFTLLHGWIHHWVTLGDFTQVGMQSFWILGWIWYVSYQLTVFVRELGTVRNSLTLIEKSHDIIDLPQAKSIAITRGEIQFENVSFSYDKKRPVFCGLNIHIPAGQKVGLVGFSGSGKSTFVNLILRFYDLSSGRIVIDGTDIATTTQDSLRSHIAMIPQDPSLFHRSLLENIRYGRLDATDLEVFEAAKLAHCHDFIETVEGGYQALVGERGVKLSGGQRQRIAIARAILKNAPILILDEATSSLDSVTEKYIQKSLKTLMAHRTTLVIAHRLSTLSSMDRILVFDKGQIVEDGTQESLLKQNGHFALLWRMQTDGFLPEKIDILPNDTFSG